MADVPAPPGISLFPTDPIGQDIANGLQDLGIALSFFTGPESAPAILIFEALAVIVEVFDAIINAIIGLFAGRPREEATTTVASRLIHAANPAARLYGIELLKLLQQQDIVISSSDPADQHLLGQAQKQFIANLVNQGITQADARSIAQTVLSRGFQNGSQMPGPLKASLPEGWTVYQPQSISDNYKKRYQNLISQGHTADYASKHAQLNSWRYQPYDQVLRIVIWKQGWNPTPPPPPPPTPPGGQPPTPPPVFPIPPFTPQPGGDELTDCCASTAYYLSYLAGAAAQLASQLTNGVGTQPDNSDCCANVVSAIATVSAQLSSIAGALGTPASAPTIDFTPLTAALADLNKSIQELPPATASGADALQKAISSIADAISKAPATDVSAIVKAINQLFTTIDVPMPVYEALAKQGWISSEDLQLLGTGEFGSGVIVSLGKLLYTGLRNYIKTVAGYDIDPAGAHTFTTPQVMDGLTSALKTYLATNDSIILPVLSPLIDVVKSQLTGTATPQIGALGIDPDKPVASAAAVTFTAAIVAMLTSYLGIDIGESVTHVAELAAGWIGYEELRDVQIGPLVQHGIAKVADMQARARFRQELPGAGTLATLKARGLINDDRFESWLTYTGIPIELEDPTLNAAYGGISAFILIRLLETGLYGSDDLRDELTFSGMRPASQQRLIQGAAWLATASQRSQLQGELNTAYNHGLLSDQDLQDQWQSAEQNTDATALVLARAQLAKRVAQYREFLSGWQAEVKAGAMTLQAFQDNLEMLGATPDQVAAEATKLQSQLNAAQFRLQAAAERALERATAAEERKVAIKAFVNGTTNEAVLTAALIASGLTATQTVAFVAQAELQKAGGLRWVYGLQKSAGDASLLKQRVAAITDQRKRSLISDAQYVEQLQQLGIPDHWINGLRAAANAMLTPKSGATATPVQTR